MLRANDFSDVLCKMCVEMTLRISRNSTFSEYLRKEGAMSMSWMTYEEEIQQAKIEARRETKREVRTAKDTTTISLIKNLMETSQESFDRVCEMLKIPNKDVVRYSKMM